MKRAILSPWALHELEESRDWYEARENGLGLEFVGAVDEAISCIEQAPDRFRQFHLQYRKCLLRRFPFHLVYEVRLDCLWVLAVYHTSRDPAVLL